MKAPQAPRPHFMPVKLRSGHYARNVGPLNIWEARAVCRMAQAAPELLDAARSLRVWLGTLPPLGRDLEEEKAALLFDLNAAITKATGEPA